ncbi:MAG TPA: dihydrolipoamide acetyltransferase family protein [Gemmatimonadales bacterium]|nr:dihydrolipoamide acetyltransferase family protein [Gemmatimonadales bacterium]
MATRVYMEALSPTMEEGRVVKWHKKEGDPVKSGETLAEIETDKAVMDLVARADGVLRQVAATEGQTVPVGSVVAMIAAPGEAIDAASSAGAAAPGRTPPAAPPAPVAPAAPAPPSPVASAGAPPARAPAAPPPPAARAAPADATRVRASPLARRMAQEAGVDLKLVPGSGPGGRVVRRDLEAAAARPAPLPAASPAPSPPAVRAPELVRGGTAYEDVPLTQIRKTIAKRLATSLGPIPHFFLTMEVDMERAAEARDALNRQLGAEAKLSFNDVILKATALTLARHRACNAWFQDDHIRYWNEVHLGMAVAVEDGLITPVIRHADAKSLSEIGREARALAERARARRLQPDEYTGATFSVSNLGMFDIDQFTAVINPPEAGIIAVGTITPKPVVSDGQLVARRRLRLTMSCDHRVIDGATGAAFLQTLKLMLENPLAMLL